MDEWLSVLLKWFGFSDHVPFRLAMLSRMSPFVIGVPPPEYQSAIFPKAELEFALIGNSWFLMPMAFAWWPTWPGVSILGEHEGVSRANNKYNRQILTNDEGGRQQHALGKTRNGDASFQQFSPSALGLQGDGALSIGGPLGEGNPPRFAPISHQPPGPDSSLLPSSVGFLTLAALAATIAPNDTQKLLLHLQDIKKKKKD